MRVRLKRSIGATIFGAFVAMGLLTGLLGALGFYVLSAAGNFVVATYEGPLLAIDFARSASLVFAQMEKEELRRHLADHGDRAAIDANIEQLTKNFFEDLSIADNRSVSTEAKGVIEQISQLVLRWSDLRNKGDDRDALRALDTVGEQVIERFDALIELTVEHSFVERRKAVSSVDRFKQIGAAATVLALVLSALITLFLARRIITPLSSAVAIADRIAGGELDTPIPKGGKDETGTLLRSMMIMQDSIRAMVEREKLQRRSAQNRLFHALESSNEAMVLVDSDGRIALVNSQLTTFFPAVVRKIGVDACFEEVCAEIGERFVKAVAHTNDGHGGERRPTWSEVIALGGEFQVSDGRWLRVSRSNTQDGGFFLVFSDFTEIKEREEHLRTAMRQAEAASEAKSNFLANMSHELRTPLNAIIGFSEIFTAEIFGKLGSPRYVEYAGNILESGRHLLAIINGLLDLAKSEAGKLELSTEPVEIQRVLRSCTDIMRDQCVRGQLTLDAEEIGAGVMVWGDPAKLRQIVLNLLSNAVKFTEPGGSIALRLAATEDGFVNLQITDTGIGMSAEEIPIALTPFAQIDTRLARRYAGTGLGLPLTKALVDLHGGQLIIESEPGKGTTVTVALRLCTTANGPQRLIVAQAG